MKHLILSALLLLSLQSHSKGLGGIIEDLTRSTDKSKTIEYTHVSKDESSCESDAKRIAKDKVIALCQKSFSKECVSMGKESIISPVEESAGRNVPVEDYYTNNTNDKRGCEQKALEEAEKLALLKCKTEYGTQRGCEIIDSVVTSSVRRTVHQSTFGGMFKKYKCSAKAVSTPSGEGEKFFQCSASASARIKKLGWREIRDLIRNMKF